MRRRLWIPFGRGLPIPTMIRDITHRSPPSHRPHLLPSHFIHHYLHSSSPCPLQCTGHPPLFMDPFLPFPGLFLCYLVSSTLLLLSKDSFLPIRPHSFSVFPIVGLKSILIDLGDRFHALFLSVNPLLSVRIYITPILSPSFYFYFFSLPFIVCPIRPSP